MKTRIANGILLGSAVLAAGLLAGCAASSETSLPAPSATATSAVSNAEIAAAQQEATTAIEALGLFAGGPGVVGNEASAALSKLESTVSSLLSADTGVAPLNPSGLPGSGEVATAYSEAEQAITFLAQQLHAGNPAARQALQAIDAKFAAASSDRQGY